MEDFKRAIKDAIRGIIDAQNIVEQNQDLELYLRESTFDDNPDKEIVELIIDYIVLGELWREI